MELIKLAVGHKAVVGLVGERGRVGGEAAQRGRDVHGAWTNQR